MSRVRTLPALLLLAACASEPAEPTPAPLFSDAPAEPTPAEVADGLRFVDATADSGLRFMHAAGRTDERWMPEIMGSGVVVADFTRDGAPDVVLVNSGSVESSDRGPGANTRFFVNLGQGRFEDRTRAWGLASEGYGLGAAAGDVDNDGYLDLVLTHWGTGERLFMNRGDRFEAAPGSGLDTESIWSSSAGFLDADGDGNLDLYVGRYTDYRLDDAVRCYARRIHIYCKPTIYDGLPDRFFLGDGRGGFRDASESSGISAVATKSLALAIADLDLDGDADIYVADDLSRNLLWLSRGDGTFEEAGRPAGVAYSEVGTEEAGMGADVSDVDGDGLQDLVCTNFQGQTTSLYTRRPREGGGLFFQERSDALGIGATARARLSFGVEFFDADNDGDEDLMAANGHINDNIAVFADGVTFEQLNSLYRNDGGRFTDVSDRAGSALQDESVSRGLATGDLDGDGDLDFVLGNNGGLALVGRNETPAKGQWLSLWLEGRGKSNRSAIGAVVRATVGERTIVRQVQGAQSFLSMSDLRVHVGLGDAGAADVVITWPDGTEQALPALPAGSFYRVVQGEPAAAYVPGERVIPP